ncbi:MAG: zinc ribbon domain-containing protein [Gammaproteobacteria bacterium]|nr:zinc ribbon domain-containing protein [Gammaproteobacteria bacterium]
MPIYEYSCTNCDHKLEILQKMNDALLQKCPECEKNTLKKMISAAGFRLKGSGWYETDFKNKGKQNDGKETAKSGKPDETKKAEKPAATKESAANDANGGAIAANG